MGFRELRYEFIESYDYDSHNFNSKDTMEYIRMRRKELKAQARLKSEGSMIRIPLFQKNLFKVFYRFATKSGTRINQFENYYILVELTDTEPNRCHAKYSLVRDKAVRWKEILLALFCILLGVGVMLYPEAVTASRVIFGCIALLGVYLLFSHSKETPEDVRPAVREVREILGKC